MSIEQLGATLSEQLGGIPVFLQHTARKKTASVQVLHTGVRVLLPKRISNQWVEKWVTSKAQWIAKAWDREQTLYRHTMRKYDDGEWFRYLNVPFCLKVTAGKAQETAWKNASLSIHTPWKMGSQQARQSTKKQLYGWYQAQAKRQLVASTEQYQKQIGVFPTQICVREYKTRWGSCTTKGKLSYNWRLIMVPLEVLNYVVVHELCHLIHLNHSPAFWQAVEKHTPNYKAHKQWLKDHGGEVYIT